MTSKNQLADNSSLYAGLGNFTNLMRAFPFVILMIVILPVTRVVVGTTIGPIAASLALGLAGIFILPVW